MLLLMNILGFEVARITIAGALPDMEDGLSRFDFEDTIEVEYPSPLSIDRQVLHRKGHLVRDAPFAHPARFLEAEARVNHAAGMDGSRGDAENKKTSQQGDSEFDLLSSFHTPSLLLKRMNRRSGLCGFRAATHVNKSEGR